MFCKHVLFALAVALAGCTLGCGLGSTGSSSTPPPTPATITAIAVSPTNSALTVGKKAQFKAMATLSDGTQKDISSTAVWGTSDTTIATVSGGNVQAVKFGGVISVKAQSGTVSGSTLLNVTQKSFDNSSLDGPYIFRITTAIPGGLQIELGSIKADSSGNFTGIEDLNSTSGVQTLVQVSGTYYVLADGRGSLTMNASGSPSRTFHFVLGANSGSPGDNNGFLLQFDGKGISSGILERQDASSFNNASFGNNTYVFRIGGDDSNQASAIATIGQFAIDSSGTNVTGGTEDVNDNGLMNYGNGASSPVSITSGTISTMDSRTGRAIATLVANKSANLVVYPVSAEKMEILGTDSGLVVTGTAKKQLSPLPGAVGPGGYVFSADSGGIAGQFWIIGQYQLDSTGSVIGLTQAEDGSAPLAFTTPDGTTSVGAHGRGAMQENTNSGSIGFTFYLVSANTMYVLETGSAHAGSGTAELQEPGNDGFGTGTLNNTFILGAAEVGDANIAVVGQIVANGSGSLTGIEDVSQPQPGNPSQVSTATVALTATYAPPSPTGVIQGTVNSSGAGMQALNLYIVSPNKALILGLAPGDVDGAIIVQ